MVKHQLPAGAGWVIGGLAGLVLWIAAVWLIDQIGTMVGFTFYLIIFVFLGNTLESCTRSRSPGHQPRMQNLLLIGAILLSLAMIGFLLSYLWQ